MQAVTSLAPSVCAASAAPRRFGSIPKGVSSRPSTVSKSSVATASNARGHRAAVNALGGDDAWRVVDETSGACAASADGGAARALSRRTAVASAAAAVLGSLTASSPSPVQAKPTVDEVVESGSFGDALRRRREVEEAAAQSNLSNIMSDIREEEAKLKALRFEREAESMRNINEAREVEEQKARQQVIEGKTLCITPFGIDFVGITETLALVGAIGAGFTSNARKVRRARGGEG